ncbi:MAG: sugar ABC transporter permease [Anaerolineae bacterium]|nr:sugar ABC transporter permease [Anaerolineae bacterium]
MGQRPTGLFSRHRQTLEAWIILAPILLYYFVFAVLPVLANLLVSFLQWDGMNQATWVGLDNYVRFFTNARYMEVLINTIFFSVVVLAFSMLLGFLVALALNEEVKGLALYRTMWYIPTLTSAAIMAQIATVFIAPGSGVISGVLKSLGQPELIWQIDPTFARVFIIVFSIWRGVGLSMLLYLAGLQGISSEVIDAAKVDGASGWKMIRFITLPLLRPTTVFVLVTGLINSFQIFEPVLLITNGQPRNTTNVMMLQIYNDAFKNQNFGMAAASATIMLLILLWASVLNIRLMRSTSVDDL